MSKRWVEKDGAHVLYFTPFYNEEKVAELRYEDDGGWVYWVYSSDPLSARNEYLDSDNLEDAKRDIEYLILEHYENERNYYQYLMDSFKEVQP